jgi:hypothetical protein
MASLDIAVEADLQTALDLPPCEEITLPKPAPLKVRLPSGGNIQAFSDLSKGIPTDCSMTFNLMLQVAPLLANLDCLLKILKLIKPLIDVVKSLGPPPDPIKLPKAIVDFVKAAEELIPCLLIPTPASILPFLKDLLCLILKTLKCLLEQLKTLSGLMHGLSLQLTMAHSEGNTDLIKALECAQNNAATQAQHFSASIEPIGVVLDLMGSLFGIVGIEPIKLPEIGSASDAAALDNIVQTLQGVTATIQVVVDALPGPECA